MGTKGRITQRMGLLQREVAEMLGVSAAKISQMVTRGQLARLSDGTIDPNDPVIAAARRQIEDPRRSFERFIESADPRAQPKRGPGREPSTIPAVIDINVHRARLEKAKADRAELQLEVERGNLVDKRQTEQTAMGLYLMVREGIEDAVERLSSLIAARYGLEEPELRKLIGDHMYDSLERLADEMAALVE